MIKNIKWVGFHKIWPFWWDCNQCFLKMECKLVNQIFWKKWQLQPVALATLKNLSSAKKAKQRILIIIEIQPLTLSVFTNVDLLELNVKFPYIPTYHLKHVHKTEGHTLKLISRSDKVINIGVGPVKFKAKEIAFELIKIPQLEYKG